MELRCAVQKYAWGKAGKSSLVAQLSQGNSTAPIVEDDPYAELWMGTHPSGPSVIKSSNEPLLNHLLSNVDSLGDEEKKVFGTDLPFLFKALSVAKALSIQAHPNKVMPKYLFNPYSTDRFLTFSKLETRWGVVCHSPWSLQGSQSQAWNGDCLARALWSLVWLQACSRYQIFSPRLGQNWFDSLNEALAFDYLTLFFFYFFFFSSLFTPRDLSEIDELAAVVGKSACEALVKAESDSGEMQALRECFSALMNTSEESIASALKQFEQRIPSLSSFPL